MEVSVKEGKESCRRLEKDFPGPGNSRGKALRAAVCYFYSMFNCPHNADVEEGHRILSDLGTRLRA